MRPKPQLSQQQTVETKVVTRMALFLSLATEAMAPRKRLQILAEAMAEPKTSTRAICMEKDSRPQKPFELPQASTSSRGDVYKRQEVVRLYWFHHNCKDGQYSSAKVHRSVQAELIASDAIPACAEDYKITLEPLAGLEPEILNGI